MTGRQLNSKWNVGARHALYSATGDWYHNLRRFPGALFDARGYVLFQTERDYKNCPQLQINQDLFVPNGIVCIPGYVRKRLSSRSENSN
jgi:5-methylcytosine-specific restriction enzyme A